VTERQPPFASVEEALEDIRAGRMIVLVDDEDRENEGDLTMAAEKVTPAAINFMAKFGRGLICLAMTEQRCDALALAPITPRNTSMFGTPFCEPIDARRGTTTGTSAADRAATILAATSPDTHPEDLARPGHVYTLRARNGGVLVRAGAEAFVTLLARAGRAIPYRPFSTQLASELRSAAALQARGAAGGVRFSRRHFQEAAAGQLLSAGRAVRAWDKSGCPSRRRL